MDLSKEKPSISQVLNANRSLVMVLLGVPIIGMLIAVVLILYKRPDSTILALGVIFFIAVQYLIMMYLFMKRVEYQAKKKSMSQTIEEATPEIKGEIRDNLVKNENQLLPEERRIFDIEKEDPSEENNHE